MFLKHWKRSWHLYGLWSYFLIVYFYLNGSKYCMILRAVATYLFYTLRFRLNALVYDLKTSGKIQLIIFFFPFLSNYFFPASILLKYHLFWLGKWNLSQNYWQTELLEYMMENEKLESDSFNWLSRPPVIRIHFFTALTCSARICINFLKGIRVFIRIFM